MFDPTLVHEFLRRSARWHPQKEALIFEHQRITYGVLDSSSDRAAAGLMHLGLLRHERVVIFMDNGAETVIALYGILKAGGAFVIVHGALKAPKLSYILGDSGATILITHTKKSPVVAEACEAIANPPTIIWVGDASAVPEKLQEYSCSWNYLTETIGKAGSDPSFEFPRIIDSDLATLIYTSGSTGEPKGVISSHHNMISAARSIIQYVDNEPDDKIIDTLPLSFDYGLYQVIMTFMFGGTIVLEQSFLFPIKILQKIQAEKVTGFPIVPTIVAFLLNMPSFTEYDLSSVRYLTNTGAALPVEHIRKLRRILPGARIFSMYGLTECKRVAYLPPEDIDRKPASVGKAMPNCEVFIVDEEGRKLAPGQIGELVIRGSNVMRGYWNAPDITERTYRDGILPGEKLLYSGDYFKMDEESYLYFVGRKDDLIKTKGERVSPKEIENIICRAPGVADAAVIGVPEEMIGYAIKAFIVPANGNELDKRSILKFCSTNMEIFMVPKYIEFLKELPKTPNGKIDKKSLKKLPVIVD
jgi:long-chain acyl-CoA synthetase